MVTDGTSSGTRAGCRVSPAASPPPRAPRRPSLAPVPALVLLALACGDASPAAPRAGSPVPPAPPVSGVRPSLTAVSPTLGSTGGGTPLTLTGAGFATGGGNEGAQVVVGGIPVPVNSLRIDSRSPGTAFYFDTPAHPAGPVDVVVINPGGLADTLAGAYTYAEPETFDFNGEWWGFEIGPEHNPISFTVRNNVLERVWCEWEAANVTLSPAPSAANGSVSRGAFSYARADGVVAISGRIVDAATAVGTLNIASCPAKTWLVKRVVTPK